MTESERLFTALGTIFPNRIRAILSNGHLIGMTGPYPFALLEGVGAMIEQNCPTHGCFAGAEAASISARQLSVQMPEQSNIVVRFVHFDHPPAKACEVLAVTVGPPHFIGYLSSDTWAQSPLSQREVQLALGLAAGRSLHELAKEHRVSINTVRNQIKNAMRATGTHSQTHLTSLIRDWLV
ncbi:hypothetical protein GCM10011515_01510 [Tsuneonella deserti]|uniref:HTH luxR-type domain-containing protein n=1 Tax=Tsuneonella deserti TaxID=2035528 RepID=A0ABQ1RXP1_9SPHN|nr:helix-turn-helix transcriptional regulator [Tsuneonella deserti]GGD85537.1 hypothetical protein GCM10011515_01510 [Tsuneonella deserti]